MASRIDTYEQLMVAQERRFAGTQRSVKGDWEQIVMGSKDDLRELTSGTISEKTLRKMGHPFGRTGNKPGGEKEGKGRQRRKIKRLPINRQTGALQRGITTRFSRSGRTFLGGGVFSGEVFSTAPHAQYILHPSGTRKMVGRGVMGRSWDGLSKMSEMERRHRSRLQVFETMVRAAQRRR